MNPCLDGDCNSVSYFDILNYGWDGDWVFFFPGGNELDVALDFSSRFEIAIPDPCPGDCNGDGLRNITDLGLLLADFGGPGACDTNGDGVINITDLGTILANFGQPCPP